MWLLRATSRFSWLCFVEPAGIPTLNIVVPKNTLLLAVPVPFFLCCALVKQLLAFHQSDFALYLVLFPVHRQWNSGVAGLIYLPHNFANFFGVQQ